MSRPTTAAPSWRPEPRERVEDPRLLRGEGRFVHRLRPPGIAHAAFVRSPHARARILGIDTRHARAMPGVHAVFTADDLAGLAHPGVNPLVQPLRLPERALLSTDQVRSVGEAIALVIAVDASTARRAAELVEPDLEPLPLDTPLDAAMPDGQVAALRFARDAERTPLPTDRVVTAGLDLPRVAAVSIEPRGLLAEWDEPRGRLVVSLGTQALARARDEIARVTGLPAAAVQVRAPDVGGAFGAKASVHPEELLVAWAAHRLRRSVSWQASRSEEFLSGTHGRGASLSGTLSLDAQGRFIRLAADLRFPLGAWLPFSAVVPMRNAARILPGPYRIESLDVRAEARLEPRAAVGIYRGAGRPEACLLIERLVEAAARQLSIDPIELRRRNLIAADAMPWTGPTGETLDSGDFPALLEAAARRFDYPAARAAQARRRADGECVGIGTALYVEPCGQGWESASVTLAADGSVRVASGTSPQGQGHRTSLAQIAAQVLDCPFERVTVLEGDTDVCPPGIGALASRSMAIGGSAVAMAARQARARREAGETLPIHETAVYHAPAEAWSSGCVIAQVSVDRDTGQPRIERLVWIDDIGRVINPLLTRGQMLGGLAQGLGQAMFERLVYDEHGQLLTGSLMDYAVPRAEDMPPVEIESLCTPSAANALGVKGVGESGCIGVPAALLNAAIDALAPLGVDSLDLPLTSENLWLAMSAATRP